MGVSGGGQLCMDNYEKIGIAIVPVCCQIDASRETTVGCKGSESIIVLDLPEIPIEF
jgi:hypothetical protein